MTTVKTTFRVQVIEDGKRVDFYDVELIKIEPSKWSMSVRKTYGTAEFFPYPDIQANSKLKAQMISCSRFQEIMHIEQLK